MIRLSPILTAALCVVAVASHAESFRYLRFEPDEETKAEPDSAISPDRIPASRDVPAPYIYNPQSRISYPNETSVFLRSTNDVSQHIEIPFDPRKESARSGIQSFTLEMFVKATNIWQGPVAFKTPKTKTSTTWMMGAIYRPQWKQTYYGAHLRPPNKKITKWTTGHYLSISRQRKETLNQWRHMAFVYDAIKQTATLYVD